MSASDYQVLSVAESDAPSLQANVVAAMGSGWQPTGAPFVANHRLYQAMIKGTPVGSGGADYTLPAATTGAIGGVKEATHQADSVAATLGAMVIDFNALLAKLQTAGIMA